MAVSARNLRLVLRRLAQSPLFTFLTVLTLAVGIGSVSAVSSVLDGVLLKPLPFEDSDRLVAIWHKAPGVGEETLPQAPALYFTYREQAQSFSESGVWQRDLVAVTELDQPQQLEALRVTDGVLPLLGVEPLLGRVFTAEDVLPESPATVILQHGYFERQFGGDRGVLGKTLQVDGTSREIIGVLGPDFRFPGGEISLVLPNRLNRAEIFFGQFSFRGIARLKDGVTLAQANAEMARLIPGAIEAYPMPPGISRQMFIEARLTPDARPFKLDVIGNVGQVLWVIFATVGLVLLVAAANVANLFLARAEGRQHELAVKSALGASRRQVAGELLLESLVLSLGGAVVGLGLAWLGLQLLTELAPRGLPRLGDIALDGRVVVFTTVVAVLTAAFCGAVAAARLGSVGAASALKDEGRGASGSRGRRRARNFLVVAQISLSLVLLIGSGLLIRTFQAMRDVHPGFDQPEELLTFRLEVPEGEVPDQTEVLNLWHALRDRLAALPGVSAVSFSSSVPMDGNNNFDPVFVEDHPVAADQIPAVRRMKFVTPGFFATLGTPLLAGRDLAWADLHEKNPVAVVSATIAREYWGSPEKALGKRIRESPSSRWREIVGVASDVRDNGVDQEVVSIVYWPAMLLDWWTEPVYVERSMVALVRSSRVGTPSFLSEVQRAVWSVNSNLPLSSVRTQAKILEGSMARTSFTMVMLGIAAAVALLLGAVGTYGVTSYVAAQRTRELGVRMALGADRQDVTRLVLGHGATLAAVGVALGLAGSAAATRAVAKLLYGVSPLDPLTFAVVGLTVTLVALFASYGPARRAARLDPVESLRR